MQKVRPNKDEHQIHFWFQKIDICFRYIFNNFYVSVAFFIICLTSQTFQFIAIFFQFQERKIVTNKNEEARNFELLE